MRRETDRRGATKERDDLGLGFHARARPETGIEVHGETCVAHWGLPLPGSIAPRILARLQRLEAGTALALSSRTLPYGLQIARHRSLHGNPLPLLRPPSSSTKGAHLRPQGSSLTAAFPALSRPLHRPPSHSIQYRLERSTQPALEPRARHAPLSSS